MQKLLTFLKKNWLLLAVLAFIASRLYIFLNPPPYVRYFEEYANIWYYGWPPYLKHWFEYPPATIPFISGPLLLDLAGIGKYRLNFRIMTLVIDVVMFGLILATMRKLNYSWKTKLVNAFFYIALTIKAKDFMYENLDLLFSLTMFLPAVAPLLMNKGKSVVQWFFYWLGTGIKMVNAPLALLYFFDSTKPLRERLILPIITCAVIWAIPLGIYRSSLSVIIVYHKDRQLQVESFPSLIVRGINIVTKSEEIYFSDYKSFDLRGPISNVALPIANLALASLMGLLVIYIVLQRKKATDPVFLMKVTLIFIFSYFTANKVFSTPYHLWYLPLLVIYPYRNWKERGAFFAVSAIFLGVATTPIPSIEVVKGIFLDTSLPVFTQIPATLFLLWGAYHLELPKKVNEIEPSALAMIDEKVLKPLPHTSGKKKKKKSLR